MARFFGNAVYIGLVTLAMLACLWPGEALRIVRGLPERVEALARFVRPASPRWPAPGSVAPDVPPDTDPPALANAPEPEAVPATVEILRRANGRYVVRVQRGMNWHWVDQSDGGVQLWITPDNAQEYRTLKAATEAAAEASIYVAGLDRPVKVAP